jgi:ribonucleoside-diphosphate reductase alpha chain
MMGKRYDSPSARVLAGKLGQALAQACLAANSCLAHDRGALPGATAAAIELARLRDTPAGLVESVQSTGVRHRHVTAITSQRRLARFANDVADALDPLDRGDSYRDGASQPNARSKRGGGYACRVAKRMSALPAAAAALIDSQHKSSITAQIGLRGAVQPWIDVPIDYPFRVAHAPDALVTERLQQLAAANRLGGLNLAVST